MQISAGMEKAFFKFPDLYHIQNFQDLEKMTCIIPKEPKTLLIQIFKSAAYWTLNGWKLLKVMSSIENGFF